MWPPLMGDLIALWTELGDDLKVGKMARADGEALQTRLRAALDKVNELEAQLGLAKADRDKVLDEVSGFATKFRSAIVATYGAGSPESKRAPKVNPSRAKAAAKPA
jgi:hypothetical protein